jgi:PAS domain S-box-containing protein
VSLAVVQQMFDLLGDVVFCIKDTRGRYLAANQAFADRVGVASAQEMLGRVAADFFPSSLLDVYDEQDAEVFSTGRAIVDQLERISNADGSLGWYLASKFPILDSSRSVCGLVGLSLDLHSPGENDLELANLKNLVERIRANLDQPLRTESLAHSIGLSAIMLDRRMKRVFRLSTKKFITKCRLEEAARRLAESDESISDIALACGFSDQSSLTRQFRAAMSVTPALYRKNARP